MKTFTKSTALIITALLISVNILANGFEMEVEEYIDDIPFNTEEIATKALYEQAVAESFEMEVETYVDDIPFNTDSLAKVALSNNALAQNFDMEEETYIDDIPFNTSMVAMEYSIQSQSMIAKR